MTVLRLLHRVDVMIQLRITGHRLQEPHASLQVPCVIHLLEDVRRQTKEILITAHQLLFLLEELLFAAVVVMVIRCIIERRSVRITRRFVSFTVHSHRESLIILCIVAVEGVDREEPLVVFAVEHRAGSHRPVAEGFSL